MGAGLRSSVTPTLAVSPVALDPIDDLGPSEQSNRTRVDTPQPAEAAVVEKKSWALALTVLLPGGQPAEGAKVMLAIVDANARVTEPLGVTDSDGRLACPLNSLDARGLALWNLGSESELVASHSHYASARYALQLEDFKQPGTFNATITLPDAKCLTGRVFGPRGGKLAGARCILWQGEDEGRRPTVLRSTLTNTEGEFGLEVEPGQRGYVQIEASEGATCTKEFDIGIAADIGTLWIDELASLGGRVVYPDGQPAHGVWVEALATGEAALDSRKDGLTLSLLPGYRRVQTTTDVHGRFQMRGLRFGAHTVLAPLHSKEESSKLEVELPCADVTLTAPRPRLIVHVTDVNDLPSPGVLVWLTPRDGPWKDAPPEVYRHSDEAGVLSAQVVHGGTYLLTLQGNFGGALGTMPETVVQIPDSGFQHEAHLVLGVSSDLCSLRVLVNGPGGEAIQEFSAQLRSTSSGRALGLRLLRPSPGGLLAELPEGTFTVKVHSALGQTAEQYLFFEEAEQAVTLIPGTTPELRFQMTNGGHLDVFLGVSGWPSGSPSTPPDPGEEGWDAWIRKYGVSVEIGENFADGGGTGNEVFHKLMTIDVRSEIGQPTGRWTPDKSARTRRALRPGRYPYRVSGPAWQPIEGVLDVRAGKTDRLNVVLVPK